MYVFPPRDRSLWQKALKLRLDVTFSPEAVTHAETMASIFEEVADLSVTDVERWLESLCPSTDYRDHVETIVNFAEKGSVDLEKASLSELQSKHLSCKH